jgi:cell division initiation protein
MNVSPLDLRQARFKTAMRGFDRIEVTSLLLAVAEDYEQSLRETDRLRQEVARLETLLQGHVQQEKSLQNTLISAQRLADAVKAGAEEAAERIVHEAEDRATFLLEKAQARVEDVQRDIDGLKLKRRDVEASLEGTIQALRNTLEFVREQDAREREEKVAAFRPRLTHDLETKVG